MEIRIKELTKIFPGDPKKNIRDTIAVKDLDFVVKDGELVGLLGSFSFTTMSPSRFSTRQSDSMHLEYPRALSLHQNSTMPSLRFRRLMSWMSFNSAGVCSFGW